MQEVALQIPRVHRLQQIVEQRVKVGDMLDQKGVSPCQLVEALVDALSQVSEVPGLRFSVGICYRANDVLYHGGDLLEVLRDQRDGVVHISLGSSRSKGGGVSHLSLILHRAITREPVQDGL